LRRRQKDEVKRFWLSGKELEHVGLHDARCSAQARMSQIGGDRSQGVPIPLYEDSLSCTPAKGLDAHLAGTGEEVKEGATKNLAADYAEER
jgi:hypothetical protein